MRTPSATRVFERLDLRDAGAVVAALERGAAACRSARCRAGSIERVVVRGEEVATASAGDAYVGTQSRGAPMRSTGVPMSGPRLIATGDLHDNPLHLIRLLRASGMEGEGGEDVEAEGISHLTLHELIHGDRLTNGMDFSYRVLTRAAALKAVHPERLHVLLANHELAQAMGQQVGKDGVRCNAVFDEAIEATFRERAGEVREAVKAFVLSLPLGLRWEVQSEAGVFTVLCAHSLPGPEVMDRFDAGVLERALKPGDFVARQGSAHMMVWGRGQSQEQVRGLAERWGVDLFVLGHEKADQGAMKLCDRAAVLNTDHERGKYVVIGAGRVDAEGVVRGAVGVGG